jgi:uracil-DNA glycosylase
MATISSIYVPDEGPEDAKILFVGEAPGEMEEQKRQPFVGESGQLLMSTLGRAGVMREEVRLANLCHYRPQGNDFKILVGSPQLEEGQRELREYVKRHKPTVICALGSQALEFLTGKKGIHAWRGSILQHEATGIKIIPTFHPAAVLRDRSLYPIFDTDIRRVIGDSTTPDLNLPKRTFIIDPQGLDLEYYTQLLCESDRVAVDIESVKNSTHILCVGFSPRPDLGICIPFKDAPHTQNAVNRILTSPSIKIFHFGTFDTEMLHLNGHETINYWWDTLTAQHVLNAELPRGLDFLASIYTREPYYKSSGRAEIPGDQKAWGTKVDKQKLYEYNCRDVCVTIEIQLEQEKELTDLNDLNIFKHEMSLIEVGQSMSRNGMLCDIERRNLFEKALYYRWNKLQALMEVLAGRPINVRSPKLKDLLYGDFKLPIRRNRGGGITTDEDAIVGLIGYCVDYVNGLKTANAKAEWNKKLLVLKAILEIRGLRQLLSNYIKAPLREGRYHSIYKFAATETGRAACEGYVDGTGVNAQTFPRGIVDVPDDLQEQVVNPIQDEELNDDEKILASSDS